MKYPYIFCTLCLCLCLYKYLLFVAYTSFGVVLWDFSSISVLYRYSSMMNIPFSHVLLRQNGNVFRLSERPVSGDHIHMTVSIYVNGVSRLPEHDRPVHEDVPYELKPGTCDVPGDIAYTKIWPHSGVHTHCDGLIHVHPWSAPRVIRKEGLDVQLGLWFDQVGIRYRELDVPSLSFGDERVDGNSTHVWQLAEYICHKDTSYNLYVGDFDKVWLGYAYSSYVLWYDKLGSVPPPPLSGHIDALLQADTVLRVGATGYDGSDYPHTCVF
jgi:hypothetical protein